ncbi:heme exporter protein CcmD [Acuticoccus sp. MNP-M23]|uniref:heme exporter protein CcmD n=1 Tax=Acuticoccus sp. MNP-M23 TaxID=3072793 RepID=UPI002816651B|nr:heme exporter protein CcmD [Acuticoccus sp. MNP-M23]WMS40830.1 heme exporter protein CcmD [Acuticoccus sp. MNP-M23]
MTGQYAAYVISAYAIGAASLGGIVAWVVVDRRSARKALARAERAAERQGAARDR